MSSHIYLRDYNTSNRKPVGCVAMRVDRENNKIFYAVSVCSPKDKWNSKIARSCAMGRLENEDCRVELAVKVPGSWNEITHIIMNDIVSRNKDQGGDIQRSYLAYAGAVSWLARPVEKAAA